jgi:hypothetical protein
VNIVRFQTVDTQSIIALGIKCYLGQMPTYLLLPLANDGYCVLCVALIFNKKEGITFTQLVHERSHLTKMFNQLSKHVSRKSPPIHSMSTAHELEPRCIDMCWLILNGIKFLLVLAD